MRIDYKTLTADSSNTVSPVERVRMLSAFEGNNAADKDGNPMFKDIVVTTNDEQEILVFCRHAAQDIENRLGHALTQEALYEDGCVQLQLNQSYELRGQASLPDLIAECVAMFAMAKWLADKLPDRAAEYMQTYNVKVEQATRMAFRKQRPNLNNV